MIFLFLLPFLLAADGSDVLIDLVRAIRDGDARLVAAAAISLIMIGLAEHRSKIAWFRGDRGGAILVMLLALGGGLVTSLGSGAPVDYKLFLTALEVALVSVGGYTWVRRVVRPGDVPPAPKTVSGELPLKPPSGDDAA